LEKSRNKDTKKQVQKKKLNQALEENRYFVYGMLFLFLLLVFLAASFKISGDDDVFWHLATGRYIIENKVVPDTDVFGFVTAGEQWIPFEWGWDVLTFGLYSLGGYNAVLAFRTVAFVFIFLMLFLLFRKFKVNSFLAILILALLLVGIMDRLTPRPHVISYIFFVTISYLLLSFRYVDRQKYIKKLYVLPVIFVIWANFHMGVLAGGLFLFIFVLTELMIYLRPRKFQTSEIKPLTKADLKTLFIVSGLCAFALLVNPHGFNTYVYAYSHAKMKMLQTIYEWASPFDTAGFVVTVYKVFLIGGAVTLYYAYVRKDLLFALIYLGFGIYSVRAVRFTVDYLMLSVFFIAVSLSYIALSLKGKSVRSAVNALFSSNIPKIVLSVVFVYFITQIPGNSIYRSLGYQRVSGWGIDGDFIPVQLFDFMKENNITGKPFNHFGCGGYLVWNFPDQKDFIDSRNLSDQIFDEYQNIMFTQPGSETKLKNYGVDYFIFLDPNFSKRVYGPKTTKMQGLLPQYCTNNNEWSLVFWDDKSMLFVRNTPRFAELISKYQYKVLNPFTFVFKMNDFEKDVKNNTQQAKAELIRKKQAESQGVIYQAMNSVAQKYVSGN